MEKSISTEEFSTNRIEAFSDGVLAIVITLMVLEIRIPAMAEHISSWDAFHQLLPILPKLLAYAFSFIMIIIFWVNHHQLFQSIRLSARGLLWLNSFWLFWICLLPFATAFLGEHPFLSLGVLLFGVELFLCALTFYFIRRYCLRNNLFESTVSPLKARQQLKKSALGPILYLAAVGLSLISIYLAYTVFIIIPVLFIAESLKLVRK
jgi:uncharacterized membrane protein